MKAQETRDAELVALAALVFSDTAMIYAQVHGQQMSEPDYRATDALRRMLESRGVLPTTATRPQEEGQ